MIKTAIISEFNPFHNGHKYIVDQAIKTTSGEIITLQSGSFVQRGEPAIFSKEERATTSINNGVSMVVELPVYYAMSNAENFALGGVSILNKLNINYLVFGSECGDISLLNKIAQLNLTESDSLKEALNYYLDKGYLFAYAKEEAYKEVYGESISSILTSPNNILAIEYLKALVNTKSNIEPITIKRKNSNCFKSSTELRKAINENTRITDYVPSKLNYSSALLQNNYEKTLFSLIQNKIATSSIEQLKNVAEITEGLENRIIECITHSNSYQELIYNIKSKRYTMAKIKRILLSLIINIDKSLSKKAINYLNYAKIIAINKKKFHLIDNVDINLIKGSKEIIDCEYNKIESYADNIYNILSNKPIKNKPYHKMIIV